MDIDDYRYKYIDMYVKIIMCKNLCIHKLMYKYVCINIYVSMFMYKYVCIYKYLRIHIYI